MRNILAVQGVLLEENTSSMSTKIFHQYLRQCENATCFARLRKGEECVYAENTDIALFLSEFAQTVDHFARQIQFRVAFQTAVDELFMAIDQTKMYMILLNLVSNSFKHMKPGGYLYITLAQKRNEIHLTLRDTGPGLSQATTRQCLSKLLLKPIAGVGLGLPIAQGLVELHGGRLMVSSKKGRGTRAVISLPIRRMESNKRLGIKNADGMLMILTGLVDVLNESAFDSIYRDICRD